MEQVYLDELKISDYLMAHFSRPADPAPVGLWIAYYDTQTKGASVHSPQACLPGGGWRINELAEHEITGVRPGWRLTAGEPGRDRPGRASASWSITGSRSAAGTSPANTW